MTVLASLRPDSWNFPLLVHVFGATVVVGGLVAAVVALVLGWKRQSPADALAFGRVGFRALLFVALPGYIVMRIGAEWIYSREGWDDVDPEPDWLGIGYVTADLGGLLVVLSIVFAGLGAWRLRRAGGGASVLGRVATVLSSIALIGYLVAVWAMSSKPA
jgi:hypothetical protein